MMKHFMKRAFCSLVPVMLMALFFAPGVRAQDEVTINILVGATGPGAELLATAAEAYMEMNPNVTINVEAETETTDRLNALYLLTLDAESADIDIMSLDIIWPGEYAEFVVDLSQYIDEETLEAHFSAIVESNQVDNRLLAIPWFTDAGILYYRTDLLDKYGFDGPPETWDELEEMARTIQEGEREEGNDDFWGYVWQGEAYEGLTVNALEWFASHGAGTFISPDGEVTVNNPAAIAALARAASWIDDISPPTVTGMTEEDARMMWQFGDAAFLRNWPYVYGMADDDELSPIAGDFDVAPLPAGEAGAAAGLGGWNLAVSAFSEHPEVAAEVVAFMTSPEWQKHNALEGGLAPTIAELYEDDEVLAVNPYFPMFSEVLENAVARPSTVTGENYLDASRLIYEAVHEVLVQQLGEDDIEAVLEVLELDLQDLTGFPSGSP